MAPTGHPPAPSLSARYCHAPNGDHISHHSFYTVIENDVRARQPIIVTLNPEMIVNSYVKCRSLWWTRMRSIQWSTLLFVGWLHVALWEHLLQEGIQILCQKEQRDKEYFPWCRFNEVDYPKARAWVFQWNLLKLNLCKVRWKTHNVQKWYIM
jgi:hypothetical protein